MAFFEGIALDLVTCIVQSLNKYGLEGWLFTCELKFHLTCNFPEIYVQLERTLDCFASP